MGLTVRADTQRVGGSSRNREGPGRQDMFSNDTRTCPRCGAVVVLPDYCRITRDEKSEQRATQLTRAVCGCWTADLSEEATLLLLGSLAAGRANAKASVDSGVA
jgi:hypothetical protein